MGLAASSQPLEPPALYRPRNARAAALYQLLEAYYEDVKAVWEERFENRYGYWRGFVDTVVTRYLDFAGNGTRFDALRVHNAPQFTCSVRKPTPLALPAPRMPSCFNKNPRGRPSPEHPWHAPLLHAA